jgi:hypothetical protein
VVLPGLDDGRGALGLAAAVEGGSISLVGWALGSVIEALASVIVIWRFTGSHMASENAERRAQRAVAVSFFLLAPYVAAEAIRDLVSGHRASASALGLAVTAASQVLMPALGYAKGRLGARLESGATAGRAPRTCCAPPRPGRCWPGSRLPPRGAGLARPGDCPAAGRLGGP